jgi:hypothetical protein
MMDYIDYISNVIILTIIIILIPSGIVRLLFL